MEMVKTKEFQVDGEMFEITTVKFEPVTSYLLLAKLGKFLIPAGLAAKDAGVGVAAEKLFTALTPELAQSTMLELLASSQCVRKDAEGALERIELTSIGKINKAFRGSLKMLLMAMQHSLEVNFGDFFAVSDVAETATPTPSP